MKCNEWLRRAIRTFFQAAIGAAAANLSIYIADIISSDTNIARNALFTFGGVALAAGVAAVMNLGRTIPQEVTDTLSEQEEETKNGNI